MVTKPPAKVLINVHGSVLAKIHMVTKLEVIEMNIDTSSVLAKIHMVTKLTYANL